MEKNARNILESAFEFLGSKIEEKNHENKNFLKAKNNELKL